MLSLFAQASQTVVSPDVAQWLGLLGSLGFAVWYGYYVTAITIPKINADNNALTAKLVDDFRSEMKLQREECRREAEQLTAAFHARLNSSLKPSNN